MSDTHKFSINNVEVKTNVITTAPELDRCLKELLSTISTPKSDLKRVVGLIGYRDERSCYSPSELLRLDGSHYINNKVGESIAILMLCHCATCLIIQLHLMSHLPRCLSRFLQLPELSFVGFGIRHSLEPLERDAGIKCRNAVDLGELASAVQKNEMLKFFGRLDLVENECYVNKMKMKMMTSFNDAVSE